MYVCYPVSGDSRQPLLPGHALGARDAGFPHVAAVSLGAEVARLARVALVASLPGHPLQRPLQVICEHGDVLPARPAVPLVSAVSLGPDVRLAAAPFGSFVSFRSNGALECIKHVL